MLRENNCYVCSFRGSIGQVNVVIAVVRLCTSMVPYVKENSWEQNLISGKEKYVSRCVF